MSIRLWWMASRPKTLWAAVAPVLVGTAIAYGDGKEHWPSAAVALIAALLIQIGTNFANDYFDCVKGADTCERVGPTRVTQAGLIEPRAVQTAYILVFTLAFLAGAWLSWRAGWPILVIGAVSIASGILYTGGPYPFGYLGLGDVFVLVFFGPVAVAGTCYVQTLEWSHDSLVAGIAPGLLATAILVVNNLRDIDTDAAVGKRTLAVRLGRTFTRCQYLSCLLGAALVPVYLVAFADGSPYSLLAVGTLLLALPPLKAVFAAQGKALNPALAGTARVLLLYCLAFSIGWIAGNPS